MTPMLSQNLREELFYKALRIRLVEEKVIELYPSDKIQSPVHLSIGQEAVAVGACHQLRRSDLLFGTYRSHSFYLAKGGDMKQMFAELYGKVTGCGRGKAGSMHLAAPEVGMMGASAVVASTTPHAVGAALAAKMRKTGQVVMAVFGDGATDQGVHHESLNLAALHQVPVLFLCENNGLAVHTRRETRQAYSIIDQASLYGIPAVRLEEGYDPLAVNALIGGLVDEIRGGGGPRFAEILTCRYLEHVGVGDDSSQPYRDQKHLASWKCLDPLLLDRELVARFTPAIEAEIAEAVAFAEASPWPSETDLLADVH
jgi:TPP-dependent pyruvate/acetoin dehydrogenase alpha subunit